MLWIPLFHHQVDAYQQAVHSSEVAVDSIQTGYSIGTRTLVDAVNSERDLLRVRHNHAQSKYQYFLNILKLKHASDSLVIDDFHTSTNDLVPNI